MVNKYNDNIAIYPPVKVFKYKVCTSKNLIKNGSDKRVGTTNGYILSYQFYVLLILFENQL